MNIIKRITPFVVIIALVSFVLNKAFLLDNQLLHLTETNGIQYLTFDLQTYIQHLQTIWTDYVETWDDLKLADWTEIKPWPTGIDILAYLRVFGHNFFVVLSWLMFPMTILTWIGNFILFAIQMLMAVLGFPKEATLYTVIEFVKQLANIPREIVNAIYGIL